MTSGGRGWSAERPPYSLAVALLGALLVVLGFAAVDWSAGLSFRDVRRVVVADPSAFAAITQAYLKALYLPLIAVVVLAGLGGTGPAGRRVAAAAGVLAGGGLVAAVVWIETGAVGTGSSRGDALPLLVAMVAVGVVAVALAAGAFFDETATLAGVAVLLHVYAVTDLSSGGVEPAAGAWLPVAGYVLLAVAPALPHRGVGHA
ncbi:MAG TPA: hypothetical protein VHC23_07240 [Jatrophihabitans sp.]|nr:hypothetical protein [Jatrophihabitans sp.]